MSPPSNTMQLPKGMYLNPYICLLRPTCGRIAPEWGVIDALDYAIDIRSTNGRRDKDFSRRSPRKLRT